MSQARIPSSPASASAREALTARRSPAPTPTRSRPRWSTRGAGNSSWKDSTLVTRFASAFGSIPIRASRTPAVGSTARGCVCRSRTWRKTTIPISSARGARRRFAGPSLTVGDRERPHRKAPHPPHLHRHGKEPEAVVGQLTQAAQVLDNWDAGPEQQRVSGPRAVARVVDVERVDADERRAGGDEVLRRDTGEIRVARPVALGAPVDVPARVYQYGLALHVPPAEHAHVERPTVAFSGADHQAFQVGDRLEREVGDVLPLLVAMGGRVDVGPGVD